MSTAYVKLPIVVDVDDDLGNIYCKDTCRWFSKFTYNATAGYHCTLYKEFMMKRSDTNEVLRCQPCLDAEIGDDNG